MKLDRRRKYYMVLDCETATLPFTMEEKYCGNRDKIAIAKPLIYDLGWSIVDRNGNIYKRENYLISEIFSVPAIFNTAHYKGKRPIYLEKIQRGEITVCPWDVVARVLEEDLQSVEAVGAYNSMFDYKKAIPFTELYIKNLYSPKYYEWEQNQRKYCDYIISHSSGKSEREFDGENFHFRGNEYPMFDIWSMACEHLLNNDDYKKMCIDNEWRTASGKYFKTSAETAYRYCQNDSDFEESHTALDDVVIETFLLSLILKKSIKNLKIGIEYFPFRILGKVEDFGM